ncbi:unnamed protein product [Effrenium voratum]|nr:unnamed protein product [Effrenium voratum]
MDDAVFVFDTESELATNFALNVWKSLKALLGVSFREPVPGTKQFEVKSPNTVIVVTPNVFKNDVVREAYEASVTTKKNVVFMHHIVSGCQLEEEAAQLPEELKKSVDKIFKDKKFVIYAEDLSEESNDMLIEKLNLRNADEMKAAQEKRSQGRNIAKEKTNGGALRLRFFMVAEQDTILLIEPITQFALLRRKVIVGVAGLEDKIQHLAGPRLLQRLHGEAWRATEHLTVSTLRSTEGWLQVLKALDEHYKYLPETELHEAIDEFMFLLKKRNNEGAGDLYRRKRRKKVDEEANSTTPAWKNLEKMVPEVKLLMQLLPQTLHRFLRRALENEKVLCEAGATVVIVLMEPVLLPDQHGAQVVVFDDLEKKMRPVFPQSVLGHLFMRKLGLSREQRAQVIRATGGSSRFQDVERIMRASDMEDRRPEQRPQPPHKGKREVYAMEHGDESSELIEPDFEDSDEEVNAVYPDEYDPEEDPEEQEELAEIYAVQQKAKKEFKKSYRTYKESKKKVREIKRARQPYLPVVASGKNGADRKPVRKEEAHLAGESFITEFNYMVNTDEMEVLLNSIPIGRAIIDTGCTSSLIGEDTVEALTKHFISQQVPAPQEVSLPPVELKGFNGHTERATKGLKWLVKLGSLWGYITTYVIPGKTPFLLSRKVLQGMEATLDMGNLTITSKKHGMIRVPLQQAANGHLMMPLLDEGLDQSWQPGRDPRQNHRSEGETLVMDDSNYEPYVEPSDEKIEPGKPDDWFIRTEQQQVVRRHNQPRKNLLSPAQADVDCWRMRE